MLGNFELAMMSSTMGLDGAVYWIQYLKVNATSLMTLRQPYVYQARLDKVMAISPSYEIWRRILGPVIDTAEWSNVALRHLTAQHFIQDEAGHKKTEMGRTCTQDDPWKTTTHNSWWTTRWKDGTEDDLAHLLENRNEWQDQATPRQRWRGLGHTAKGLRDCVPHE